MKGDPKLAFVFPGQGSQSVGMLAAMADRYPQVRETFTEASDVLGYDLWELVQNGPEEELNATVKTQPALLAASVALWRLWQEQGGSVPALLAGHSLGEYSALVCAGALRLPDALVLVAERGALMQSAVPAGRGSMAAILGLDINDVAAICARVANGQVVAVANINSPGQIVIAGHTDAVRRAVAAAREEGARRSVVLPVSVPSHCALMRDAAAQFAARVEAVPVSVPTIPVIHNVDVTSKADPAAIRQALVEQLCQPVRWVETIEKMAAREIHRFIECGPGKVLTGLARRIHGGAETFPLHDPESFHAALAASGAEA